MCLKESVAVGYVFKAPVKWLLSCDLILYVDVFPSETGSQSEVKGAYLLTLTDEDTLTVYKDGLTCLHSQKKQHITS